MRAWTDAQCRAIQERVDGGVSHMEIAEEEGISTNAVGCRLRRWRARSVRQAEAGEYVPGVDMFPDFEAPVDVDWRDLFKQYEAVNDAHRKIDPQQTSLTVDLRGATSPVCIAKAADLHLGGGFTDHREIRQTFEYILDTKGFYVMLVGDLIEGFIPGKISADSSDQMAGSLKSQIAAVSSLVKELISKQKLLCLGWGDHDAKWFEKYVGLNVLKMQFHDKAPYFNGRGLVKLLVGEEEYYIAVNHREPGRSLYNKNHPQGRMYREFFPADVNVSAHLHNPAFQMAHDLTELREAGINIGGKHWMVQTGTFKTGPDTYTIRSWTRGVLGVPTGVYYPDRHDIDMLDSPDKAVALARGMS